MARLGAPGPALQSVPTSYSIRPYAATTSSLWSAGGPTTFENRQALCGSCNLGKGNRSQDVVAARFDPAKLRAGTGELRRWQREALPIVMDTIRSEPVLVEACPGAGKTRFGLEIAFRLAEAGDISRVLIIVPTVGIADVWWTAAGRSMRHTPMLPLLGLREWRAVDPIGEGWLGAITTYQSLFVAPEMYLAHATDPGHRTLVIFDEVHHAGADASWGEAAQFSFSQGAAAILSLSGTPFRTRRDQIVFVPSLTAQPNLITGTPTTTQLAMVRVVPRSSLKSAVKPRSGHRKANCKQSRSMIAIPPTPEKSCGCAPRCNGSPTVPSPTNCPWP